MNQQTNDLKKAEKDRKETKPSALICLIGGSSILLIDSAVLILNFLSNTPPAAMTLILVLLPLIMLISGIYTYSSYKKKLGKSAEDRQKA